MTTFSNPNSGKEIDRQTKGGIKFKIEQFGEGSNAYFRLYVDGGQAGNYADKKSALTGIDDYLAERTAKNRKQVFRK